jgi:hypothetical protein
MVSVFSRTEGFSPVKLSFTSTEWCGHVYEEVFFGEETVDDRVFSYFQGESAARSLDARADGVAEDDLFIVLRGLGGDWMEPGRTKRVPFLPSVFHARLTHRPLEWTQAEISRASEPEKVTVPAGPFEAHVYTVRTDGRTGTFWIETDYPHRVVKWAWESPDGAGREGLDAGELTGSRRLCYWELNAPGDEARLEEFGLAPPAPTR